MEECVLLKGKNSEERHLQKMTLAVMQLSETEWGSRANGATFWRCNEKYVWSEMASTCVHWQGQWCVRQYVGIVTYSGGAKSFWVIESKESRSDPRGLFPKCGNKLSLDVHSFASFASCLLTSQALLFNSSVTELGLMAHRAAGKNYFLCLIVQFWSLEEHELMFPRW